MLPMPPGQSAPVLVALAVTEGRPSQPPVVNVSRVPPPATEFMAPATKAEAKAAVACQGSSPRLTRVNYQRTTKRQASNVIKKNMRQRPSLTAAEAQTMIAAAKIEAAKNKWLVTIAIVDEAGYLMHLERMDGAVLQSPDIATRKARTAALSRRPTKAL